MLQTRRRSRCVLNKAARAKQCSETAPSSKNLSQKRGFSAGLHFNHIDGHEIADLQVRHDAASLGWTAMGKYLFVKGNPLRVRRSVFYNLVYHTYLSGAEAWPQLPERERFRIESFLVPRERVLLIGDASHKVYDDQGILVSCR